MRKQYKTPRQLFETLDLNNTQSFSIKYGSNNSILTNLNSQLIGYAKNKWSAVIIYKMKHNHLRAGCISATYPFSKHQRISFESISVERAKKEILTGKNYLEKNLYQEEYDKGIIPEKVLYPILGEIEREGNKEYYRWINEKRFCVRRRRNGKLYAQEWDYNYDNKWKLTSLRGAYVNYLKMTDKNPENKTKIITNTFTEELINEITKQLVTESI